MATVTLGPFPGLNPRYERSRRGDGYADTALDVDVSDGTLRPWYENLTIAETETHNGYFCRCDWLDLTECQIATTHIGRCEEVVISGDGSNTIGACGQDRCDIRVPCPPSAPTVTATAVDTDRDTRQTQYSYSYKTQSGYETGLSYPSIPVTQSPTITPTISDFATPPDSQCVTEICIYRLMTGYRSGTEEQREDLTGWVRVTSVPVGTLAFTDSITDLNAWQAITHETRQEAPEDLDHVQAFGDGDRLIGHTCDAVYQSMPGEPHWWPTQFETTLHQQITGLAVHRNFAAAFTPEGVYLIPPGDAAELTCQRPRFCDDAPRPLISHDTKRWTTTKTSIVYVSDEGIIELSGDGGWRNLTQQWFNVDDWRRTAPETMRIGYDGKRLFFTSDTHSHLLQLMGENSQLTELSDRPERYITSPTGELLMLQNNQVEQFNSGDLRREGKWSKMAVTPLVRYRHYQVDVAGLALLSVNGSTTIVSGSCTKGKLAKYKKSRKQAIEICTGVELFKLNLASSIRELHDAPF